MINFNLNSGQSLSSLISSLQKQQDSARAATDERYNEILKSFDEMIAMYQPGGSYMQGQEAALERERAKTMAAGTQNLVSRGLGGSTMEATLAGRFAEDIGAPTRAKIEDVRMDQLVSAMQGKAGVQERVEDVGPSSELIASLVAQASAQPGRVNYGSGGSSIGQPLQFSSENFNRQFTPTVAAPTQSYRTPSSKLPPVLPSLTSEQQMALQPKSTASETKDNPALKKVTDAWLNSQLWF